MTQMESIPVLRRMLEFFPALTDDVGRQRSIMRELEKYPLPIVNQAWAEYLTLGHEFLQSGQLVAIASRMHAQAEQQRAYEQRQREREAERVEEVRFAADLKAADERLKTMGDDEVLSIWQPIHERMTGKVREWADKWTMEQIRSNRQVRGVVAARIRDERAVDLLA